MINGKALFTGVDDTDQLKKIFKIRGTPDEKTYPDLKNFSEWNPNNFEYHKAEDLSKYVPNLDEIGLDLLEKMIDLDAEKRISADEALKHQYFVDIPSSCLDLYK